MPKFKLTEEQELEIVERYMNGESIRKIAEHYPVGRTSIGYVLQRHNVETKGQGNSYGYANKKYTLNENFFSEIDTEEKAYWLGFISADGHVGEDVIAIGLSKIDRGHLEKFLKAIGSNSPIKEYDSTNSVAVRIYSKKMVSDLRKLGLLREKSKTMMYPFLKTTMHRHFIRGLFDGDGSISRGKKISISFSGTIEIVMSIKIIMMNMFDVFDSKVSKTENNFSYVRWANKKDILNILDFMYKDSSIFLDRKYKKYMEMEG